MQAKKNANIAFFYCTTNPSNEKKRQTRRNQNRNRSKLSGRERKKYHTTTVAIVRRAEKNCAVSVEMSENNEREIEKNGKSREAAKYYVNGNKIQ